MSSIGVWLSRLGIEIAHHNALYEIHSNSVIDDAYYDSLNKLYFDTCDKEGLSTAKGLHRDTGMMTDGSLKSMVRNKNEGALIDDASFLKNKREKTNIWKELTDK